MAYSTDFQRTTSQKWTSLVFPYSKHTTNLSDALKVGFQIKSGSLTQGPTIAEFEKQITRYTGSKYAVAVSSATAGLHISLLSLNLPPGSEVITSPISFLSSANCALYSLLKPVFVDIDPKTKNLDIDLVEKTIQENPNIKAVIPVHYAGLPCDMERLSTFRDKYGVRIIEDAAHALGAQYLAGEKVGNSNYSDLTVFSFHPVKSITTGEGGAITTNNPEIYETLKSLRTHGIEQEPKNLKNKFLAYTENETNPWYREMTGLGYHYRLTEIQARLGVSQFNKLDRFIKNRRELANFYDKELANHDLIKPAQLVLKKHSGHHLYPVEIAFEKININRRDLMNKLREKGIVTQVHYMPIPLNPYYQQLGYKVSDLINTLDYYYRAISIPLYPTLKLKNQKYILSCINQILEKKV